MQLRMREPKGRIQRLLPLRSLSRSLARPEGLSDCGMEAIICFAQATYLERRIIEALLLLAGWIKTHILSPSQQVLFDDDVPNCPAANLSLHIVNYVTCRHKGAERIKVFGGGWGGGSIPIRRFKKKKKKKLCIWNKQVALSHNLVEKGGNSMRPLYVCMYCIVPIILSQSEFGGEMEGENFQWRKGGRLTEPMPALHILTTIRKGKKYKTIFSVSCIPLITPLSFIHHRPRQEE